MTENFLLLLDQSKADIEWSLLDTRIIKGVGKKESIKGKLFCPINAVYYMATGKYQPPPNYFLSSQTKSGVLLHTELENDLQIDREMGRKIALASMKWETSMDYCPDYRSELIFILDL